MGLTLQWMAVGVCLVWVANVQTIINDSTAVLSPPDWGGGRSWGEREREATEDERGRVEDGKLVAEGLGYEKVKRDVKDLPAGCKTPPSVNHISQEWQRRPVEAPALTVWGGHPPFPSMDPNLLQASGGNPVIHQDS
ncbi:hypothetical protein O3P69_015047 [Scylla paramamosain]|uniref:Uncharacterized protein n=1 Tax=Scylla paramamosain TaxID=85552 RepID=A0AAW0T258_SCYPA